MNQKNALAPFENEAYLNLETFKKDGTGVRTPVWFVNDGDVLYVRTVDDSWKVKRLRNNPRARVAPCNMRGDVHGDWLDVTVRSITDPATTQKVNPLFRRKYGIRRYWFEFMGLIQRRRYVILEIKP